MYDKLKINTLKFLTGLSLALSTVVAYASELQGKEAPDIFAIKSKGYISVAIVDLQEPPFLQHSPINTPCVINNDEITPFIDQDKQLNYCGFDIALAQNLAKKLGVDLKIYQASDTYNGVVEDINLKKADIAVSTLSRTLIREQYVAFSQPYLKLRKALLVNRLAMTKLNLKRNWFSKPNSLPAETPISIGVVEGSAYVEFAKAIFSNDSIKIVHYQSWEDAVEDARSGKILAAFYDNIEVQKYLSNTPEAALFLQAIVLEKQIDEISIATHYNNIRLHAWINLFIQEIRHSGELELLKAQFGLGDYLERK